MVYSPPSHSVSVTPDPDESLIGYIFRLAARRHLTDARALALECGFDRMTNRPKQDWLDALAELARVDYQKLENISFGPPDKLLGWFRDIEMPSNMFDRTLPAERRVCPECLAGKAHHRAIWDIKCIVACPVHLKLLVDTCQACGEPLRWTGRDLTRCRCLKGDLTRMSAEVITDAEARGTKAVHGLLGDPAFAPEADAVTLLAPFQDLDEGEIVDFLCRVGLPSLPGRKKQFSMNCPGKFSSRFHIALNAGLELAEHWPQAFYGLLDTIRSHSSIDKRVNLYGSAGAVERWLAKLPEGSGSAIASATKEYRRHVEATTPSRSYRRRAKVPAALSNAPGADDTVPEKKAD